MNDIREMIESYIDDTGLAHFEHQPEGYGVLLHDEGEFIPLRDLAYNTDLGFFSVSEFPNVHREAEYIPPPPTDFTTAVFTEHDGEEEYQMWAVIPDDDTGGYIIGEWQHVLNLHATLTRLIDKGQADETVDPLDERLGHPWLGVSEAADRYGVPADTVRYAAREGFIKGATKQGRDWRFPQRHFLGWKRNVYTPRGW